MFVEPPNRKRLSYAVITALMFIGSLSASWVVAGCFATVALAPFHFDDEFSAFDALALLSFVPAC
jgi:hypothetical protein